MRIEIVSTGDEVITGNIDDTNATFLSQELTECGLEVNRRHTAGDNLAELEELFSEISKRDALVIVTGGLGPTNDDLTALAISHVANAPLNLHHEWVERMSELFKRRGRVMTSSNLKQAMLPQGSLMINNPVGTACGFAIKVAKALFIFAPGVPSELKAMWRQSIKEMVVAATNASKVTHMSTCRYTMSGIGESNLADILKFLELPQGMIFGDRAVHPFIELKLIGRNVDPQVLSECYEAIYTMLERYIVCKGPYDLMSRVNAMQFKLPQIQVVDTVCHGLLSIELQKLNIALISSMIINDDIQDAESINSYKYEKQEPVKFEMPQDNLISLQQCTLNADEQGFSYLLSFKLHCLERDLPRLYQGKLRFNFANAKPEHVQSIRHKTFLTLLCIAQMYKLTVGEPLLLPDECSVELLEFSDSMPHGSERKLGLQDIPNMQQLIAECKQKIAKLKAKTLE